MLGIAVPDYIRQALPESAAAVQKICSANAELTIAVKHVDKMTSYARPARSKSGVLDFCCRLRGLREAHQLLFVPVATVVVVPSAF